MLKIWDMETNCVIYNNEAGWERSVLAINKKVSTSAVAKVIRWSLKPFWWQRLKLLKFTQCHQPLAKAQSVTRKLKTSLSDAQK